MADDTEDLEKKYDVGPSSNMYGTRHHNEQSVARRALNGAIDAAGTIFGGGPSAVATGAAAAGKVLADELAKKPAATKKKSATEYPDEV